MGYWNRPILHKNYLREIQRNEKVYAATLLCIRTLRNKLSLHWLGRSTTVENIKKASVEPRLVEPWKHSSGGAIPRASSTCSGHWEKNHLTGRGAHLRVSVPATHQANGPSTGHGSVDLGTLKSTKRLLQDPYVLSNPLPSRSLGEHGINTWICWRWVSAGVPTWLPNQNI